MGLPKNYKSQLLSDFNLCSLIFDVIVSDSMTHNNGGLTTSLQRSAVALQRSR